MLKNNKNIWVFLPDGVGLRNFAFGSFQKIADNKEMSLTYWNNTKFPLKEKLGLHEISIKNAKNHAISDLYKRAKTEIELTLSYRQSKNKAYLSYRFPLRYKGIKDSIKNIIVLFLKSTHTSQKGLSRIRKNIVRFERKTPYYKQSLKQLEQCRPDVIFCTNQRPILAVSPIIAAQDLGIPTVSFIFSWDNIPKGTLVLETDYYVVWSSFMKEELLKYYPHIKKEAIIITGTPQFEGHYDTSLIVEKAIFFKNHNLDLNKKYICFSGDDVTTSPFDQYYLEDLARMVNELNNNGFQLGIIYRKCPVDFTNRHLEIVNKYREIITCIDPLWTNLGNGWDAVMPLKEDAQLLSNTLRYSELVVNVGSSMVFDAVCHETPCAYINYNTEKGTISEWNIEKIYEFIHFKSMPSAKAVSWVNCMEDFKKIIAKALDNELSLEETKKWYDKICLPPQKNASEHIIDAIHKIIH